MSLVTQGSQPASSSTFLPDIQTRRRLNHTSYMPSSWQWRLFFLFFVVLFYLIEIIWVKPVDGINDDWGMYSTLSGAYLGYPEAHVLFFLYPLSWLLSRLYSF